MTVLCFVDCETTGLDPDRHEIWEVAMIRRDGQVRTEHVWQLPVDLARADLIALNIGGYFDRVWRRDIRTSGRIVDDLSRPHDFAVEFDNLTRGALLVGAVISFDAERLFRLLRREARCPAWHYHIVDVEALAAGKTGEQPPWQSVGLSRLVHIDPDGFDRHTALGDARWAEAIYDAVYDIPNSAVGTW